jgi:hypothetical protein
MIGAMPPRRTFTGKDAGTEPVEEKAAATPPPAQPAPEPPPPPEPPSHVPPASATIHARRRGRSGLWTGGILILLGVIFLLGNLGLLWWWRWDVFWPLVLIAFGIWLIVRRFR